MAERFFARFTLQAVAPIGIGSGELDAEVDMPIVRDVNAMPMIPAPSLAGVLRSHMDAAKGDAMFGTGGTASMRSHLLFTDALCHWHDDRPRESIQYETDLREVEKLLRRAIPVRRDHVRLDRRGVTDGAGKFERAAAPVGTRFTGQFECAEQVQADAIHDILAGGIRIGGATRSGYGQLALIRWGCEGINMTCRERAVEYLDLGLEADWPAMLDEIGSAPSAGRELRLSGRFSGPFLIGSTGRPQNIDREPYHEPIIRWTEDGTATIDERLTVPGSSIKGPLRHRTVFHLLQSGVSDEAAELAVNCLFGTSRDDATGQAGKLVFHDATVTKGCDEEGEIDRIDVPHVGIDRFTGGARASFLFTDQMLWRPRLEIRIGHDIECESCLAWAALQRSLGDLGSGLLGLGAEWGEGAGIFIADAANPEGEQ